MGPDCGTAVVDGLGLGFANATSPGPVGIVAASGTGCQQLLALLDHAGVGVTNALGVGGRDLSSAVGGRSTREALRRLDADPAVELIVLVSKPPADDVATDIREYAAALDTPVEIALLGPGQPDLTAAAERVLQRLDLAVPQWPVRGTASPDRATATSCTGCSSEAPCATRSALIAGRRAPDGRLRRRRAHPGPGAPDDRPHDPARPPLPASPTTRAPASSCSTWCSATAPSPTRRPRSRRSYATSWRRGCRSSSPASVRRATRRAWPRNGRPWPRPAPRSTCPTPGPRAGPSTCWERRRDPDRERGSRPVRRRDREPGRGGRPGDLAAADGRHRSRPRDGCHRPAARRRQRPGAGRRARRAGDAGRRPSRLRRPRPPARPVPPRRTADRVGHRLRPAPGRADGRRRARGAGRRPRAGGRAVRRRRLDVRAVPPPRRGRPDGGCGVAEHVAVRARGPGHRAPYVLLAERGPRQGAPVRRVRARGARPAALDVRGARAAAADRRRGRRAGRRHRDPDPDAPDGRRGAQPQPRRHPDAAARPRSGDGRLRRRPGRHRGGAALRRRQRPLLPQPGDAGLQARARRGARHRGVDDGGRDGPQRHRVRDPGRGHRRHLVHRAGAGRRGPLPR